MKNLRSSVCTTGRKMAGARSLWRANGMKEEQFGQPVIAVVNSFTQFVPGHVGLRDVGRLVATWVSPSVGAILFNVFLLSIIASTIMKMRKKARAQG